MDTLLKYAKDAGMSDQQAKDMLGGVLSLLQSKNDDEQFSKIESAVPGASDLASEVGKKSETGASGQANELISGAMSMFGGGGGSASSGDKKEGSVDSMTKLITFLGTMGIKPEQVQKYRRT